MFARPLRLMVVFGLLVVALPLSVAALPVHGPQTPSPVSASIPPISAPAAPALQPVAEIGGVVTTVAVSGTLAYINENQRLTILDIGNPAQPVRRSSTPFPGGFSSLVITGNVLYIVVSDGLQAVDVRDTLHPTVIGRFTQAKVGPMHVVNQRVYLGYSNSQSGAGGLAILDVSDPTNMRLLGRYEVPVSQGGSSYVFDVQIINDLVYLATGSLLIVDAHDPTQPVLRGSYSDSPDQYGVSGRVGTAYVVGDYAYLGVTRSGGKGNCIPAFQVVRVSDPEHPTRVADLQSSGCYLIMTAAGNHLYVGNTSYDYARPSTFGGLAVYDLSNPTSPAMQGTYSNILGVEALQVTGDTVYLAARGNGLHIVDVRDK